MLQQLHAIDPFTLAGLYALFTLILEITGIVTAVAAIRDTRTPQGAIAWAMALIAIPFIALPLYWVFGRDRFRGYTEAIESQREEFMAQHDWADDAGTLQPDEDIPGWAAAFESLAGSRFQEGNRLRLYTEGHSAFEAIYEVMDQAKEYLLAQFFIVRDDGLGREFKRRLLAKARQGVRVSFLYDRIGSHSTPASYFDELREAGVAVHPFISAKGRGNRFQINFRNHRKIVVADGQVACVGGFNVGDEYLGMSKLGFWRDTMVRCEGPAVAGVQFCFAKDWYWACGELLQLNKPQAAPGGSSVLALDTGPSDTREACSLMYIHAINNARRRLWIASPYFVPDSAALKALQLASERGVDVRIIVPERADHLLVYLAGFDSFHNLHDENVRIFRYTKGFLHQKVLLMDDELALVGTANMDNRSFRLNFEITMLVRDQAFCKQIEAMLENDIAHCREAATDEVVHHSYPFRIAVRTARLFGPIL